MLHIFLSTSCVDTSSAVAIDLNAFIIPETVPRNPVSGAILLNTTNTFNPFLIFLLLL